MDRETPARQPLDQEPDRQAADVSGHVIGDREILDLVLRCSDTPRGASSGIHARKNCQQRLMTITTTARARNRRKNVAPVEVSVGEESARTPGPE